MRSLLCLFFYILIDNFFRIYLFFILAVTGVGRFTQYPFFVIFVGIFMFFCFSSKKYEPIVPIFISQDPHLVECYDV